MNRGEYMDTLRHEFKTRIFWRDVCVEIVATFILMSVQCSLPLSWDTLGQAPTVFGNIVQIGIGMGFVVCATAWTFADFGGCHMNPAVTFSMMLATKITVLKGAFYIIAQCIGAMAGAGFLYAVTPAARRESLAATVLNPDLEPWQGMLVEVWLTFILVCTIQGATNERRKGNVYMPTIVIGCAVTVGVMSGSAQTGASMNPARSFGPAVVMGIWSDHWIYWVGPFLGGALAVGLYHYVLDKLDVENNSHKIAPSEVVLRENSLASIKHENNGLTNTGTVSPDRY